MAASEIRSSARVAPRSVRVEAATSTTISAFVRGRGLDGPGARHVADGAVAHEARLDGLVVARLAHRADREPHAVALEDLALVGVVERRERDVLAVDVAPDVDLGPVADREDAHVLARSVPGVEEVPQLGPLVLRVPLAELVAEADDALLGARLLLVASAAAEDTVETVVVDGVEQRQRLERVAGAVGALAQPAVVDVVLHARDDEPQAEPLDGLVAVGEHLGEVVARVDVQHREGDRRRPEGLRREVEHDDGVLAAAEEQRRTLELARHLADDEDRLGLERVEVGEAAVVGVADGSPATCAGRGRGRSRGRGRRHVWSPHSVLEKPAQRPARGSSPGSTRRVHGSQPIDG